MYPILRPSRPCHPFPGFVLAAGSPSQALASRAVPGPNAPGSPRPHHCYGRPSASIIKLPGRSQPPPKPY